MDTPQKKRILVTGSGGFLGQKVVRALEAKGHSVTGFDVLQGQDLLNPTDIENALTVNGQIDVCVHLAAVADLNIFAKTPEISQAINVDGTRLLLAACVRHNTRMLFAGTCCSYGNNGKVEPNDEDFPLCPTEPYAQSKVDSEKDIKAAGLPHTIMRLATFYGPHMRMALCPAVFLDRAMKDQPLNIHGPGTQTRTFTYVDDIVSGIVVLTESEARHNVVNVSTTESVSVLRIAELAKELTGKPDLPVVHVEDRKGQIHHEAICNKRLKSYGWEPKTNFEEGMRQSYQWLQGVQAAASKHEE
eukprot:TRINITY_DN2581_c0_g1_i1.p1 TRINITY_DN2581_c0_g1~~TRINITY_DN2581_c0_g1_i1.p1  ORF type:complete len:302 (+),score=45.76 TRINITY_DN2581_c0_g1_i1:141-1046(+)